LRTELHEMRKWRVELCNSSDPERRAIAVLHRDVP